MSKPKRIQLRRTKGWRLPPNTVVVSRPSKYGNPYRIGFEVKDAAEAKLRYLGFLAGYGFPEQRAKIGDVRKLRGKNLACWCPLGRPCHADVLLEIANKP